MLDRGQALRELVGGLPGVTATRYPFPVAENALIDPPMRAVATNLSQGAISNISFRSGTFPNANS